MAKFDGKIWVVEAFAKTPKKWFPIMDYYFDGNNGLFFWSRKAVEHHKWQVQKDNPNMKLRVKQYKSSV